MELLKQGFRMEGIAKTMFPQKTFIGDSRVEFWCFLEALGAGFLSFTALETGLKIECFSRSSWGARLAPGNKAIGGWGLKMVFLGRSNNLSTISWVIALA